MLDSHNRNINYLRISVTDLCNQRCTYCMPESGVKRLTHKDILSFEEIYAFTKEAVSLGVNKVRLTGGEPLVRKNIMKLVEMLAQISGIEDYAMTTNALLLSQYANDLKSAGLQRLNISLDSMCEKTYGDITRGSDLNVALGGIDAAKKAGFENIKINCVINESSNEPDALAVAEYARNNSFNIRFIRRMDISAGEFWTVQGGDGGDCKRCNRLRLSSDGWVYSCLFNDFRYSVRELGAKEAINQAVINKPESGHKSEENNFYTIGG